MDCRLAGGHRWRARLHERREEQRVHRDRETRPGPHFRAGQRPRVHRLPEVGDIQARGAGLHRFPAGNRDVGAARASPREGMPFACRAQHQQLPLDGIPARSRQVLIIIIRASAHAYIIEGHTLPRK
jgi:hypothetical protein